MPQSPESGRPTRYKVGRGLRSLILRPVYAAAMALGAHPYAPLFALRYGRRGNLVSCDPATYRFEEVDALVAAGSTDELGRTLVARPGLG